MAVNPSLFNIYLNPSEFIPKTNIGVIDDPLLKAREIFNRRNLLTEPVVDEDLNLAIEKNGAVFSPRLKVHVPKMYYKLVGGLMVPVSIPRTQLGIVYYGVFNRRFPNDGLKDCFEYLNLRAQDGLDHYLANIGGDVLCRRIPNLAFEQGLNIMPIEPKDIRFERPATGMNSLQNLLGRF